MKTILLLLALLGAASANASTMLLWSCKLLEGHNIEEVKTINSLGGSRQRVVGISG